MNESAVKQPKMEITEKSTQQKPTAISFFAGAGGMDAGFSMSGFDVKVAIEIDPSCCDTLRKNLKNTIVINEDINNISAASILDYAGLSAGEVDCIFGGPPCQSFSLAGKREGLNDDRGLLVFRFIDLVRQIRPKTFVMENVKGMVNWQGGIVIKEVERMLEEPLITGEKYKVTHRVLNSADYGVPQSRERVFVVGSKLKSEYKFPQPTHSRSTLDDKDGKKPYVTVGDALSELPSPGSPSKAALRVSQSIKGRIAKHGY